MTGCSQDSEPVADAIPTSEPIDAKDEPTTTVETVEPAASANTADPVDAETPQQFYSDDELLELTERLGLEELVAIDGNEVVSIVSRQVYRHQLDEPISAWSDGDFLYWIESRTDANGTFELIRSVAATLDGTEVCEFGDWMIRHVTERPDGSVVAAVERPWGWGGDDEPEQAVTAADGRSGIPAFAAECATGAAQPIEPLGGFGGATETWSIERIGGRIFEFAGDAEGNADVTNETGVDIDGDGPTANHQFTPDGSQVVHLVYSLSAAAAPAFVVRSASTDTGLQQWSAAFDEPITYMTLSSDRVFVGLVAPDTEWLGFGGRTASIAVLDLTSGDQLDELEMTLELLHTD